MGTDGTTSRIAVLSNGVQPPHPEFLPSESYVHPRAEVDPARPRPRPRPRPRGRGRSYVHVYPLLWPSTAACTRPHGPVDVVDGTPRPHRAARSARTHRSRKPLRQPHRTVLVDGTSLSSNDARARSSRVRVSTCSVADGQARGGGSGMSASYPTN
ncbi:hypothetical protein L227DRAFT_66450 [Lentinus tigrinus ALCF2SS1-6]|uniref:Uncharacterized protein n=1 Tax=Lentinus tigrinus ALCF2SS1-6 TaxID=1328759 RepID=A0A5C2SDY8_9APHY|nr:hypothetical protein L227DRAFT_66450 [Lentinus tigrinus ALCF2SS1-6]